MRYRLRTLLIVLALGPPLLAAFVYVVATVRYWADYRSHENGHERPPTFHRPSP
jgi:hypothetical protein